MLRNTNLTFKKILYFLVLSVLFTGCINQNIMLKTKKDFVYTKSQDKDSSSFKEYKISPNDIIEFRIFSNDGFKLIDLTSIGGVGGGGQGMNFMQNSLQYNVDKDGSVKLPILGKTPIKGYTLRQAEFMLETKYSEYYIKPFVLLSVTNRRVIVFPGSAGSARVIYINNNNTTLIEAIALAGGISENGKARKVKLIRGDLKNPEVYLIDLSTIEGIKQAEMAVQANDIIYVEPRRNISVQLLREITPVLSLVTSILLAYGLIARAAGN